ncbi:unnamed protein product [Protopolystoma xenopodis]|uniref:Uncharacterized protein n=1 Tax=Protopolystoma xenopodis TaxID=117903 RepID=A0A3S5BQ98_9PLAT|nr:unnamed protein product [Protopolystoma xenopodis]
MPQKGSSFRSCLCHASSYGDEIDALEKTYLKPPVNYCFEGSGSGSLHPGQNAGASCCVRVHITGIDDNLAYVTSTCDRTFKPSSLRASSSLDAISLRQPTPPFWIRSCADQLIMLTNASTFSPFLGIGSSPSPQWSLLPNYCLINPVAVEWEASVRYHWTGKVDAVGETLPPALLVGDIGSNLSMTSVHDTSNKSSSPLLFSFPTISDPIPPLIASGVSFSALMAIN